MLLIYSGFDSFGSCLRGRFCEIVSVLLTYPQRPLHSRAVRGWRRSSDSVQESALRVELEHIKTVRNAFAAQVPLLHFHAFCVSLL